jgi:glycerate dehydrogenase
MEDFKIVVLDGFTTNPGDLDWSDLFSLGNVQVYDFTEPVSVTERLKGVKAAITNKVRINAELMDKLPDLKYIGIMATGTEIVDVEAAKKRGIIVTNVPVYANFSVAQLVFGLILELCYRIDLHNKSVVEDKQWSNQPYNSYWLKPLVGLERKKLGIIGMGKIGERVAIIGTAFGMEIMANDVYQREVSSVVEWVDIECLLKNSDIVSIHCPLLPQTRGIINKNTLKIMKPNAFFINTARGPLMVEEDLADALNNDVIAGAGLDVLEQEPPKLNTPLFNAKNVIITPHIGWATVDARKKLIREVALNLEAFLKKEKRNIVNEK